MNSHDIGRGRGGWPPRSPGWPPRSGWPASTRDRLYPLALQAELAELLPGDHPLTVVHSRFGHDGFLLESEQVGAVVARALDA